MALTLSAEQKSIEKIFINDRFIIPSYQRPYSWTQDQCQELWDDLIAFFESNKREEGYFLGNIIFAKSNEWEELEIIDGQQRLITLTLLLRALYLINDENGFIEECIWYIDKSKKERPKLPRIKTVVRRNLENDLFNECLNTNQEIKDICNKENNLNRFKSNFCFFRSQLEKETYRNQLESFSDFLLKKVYMLPIQSTDQNQDNAREKALTIFETINNRGLDLSDADIFKSQIAHSALNQGRENTFIDSWDELEKFCEDTIPATKKNDFRPLVDVFRIYMHILRSKEQSPKPEIGLRQFFTSLPLKKRDSVETMNDLNHIIASVKFIDDVLYEKSKIKDDELRKWLHLIELYSNLYPKYALYAYLFTNAQFEDYVLNEDSVNVRQLTLLAKELVRCAYYTGSTTAVKHIIYRAITTISKKEEFIFKIDEKQFNENSLSYFGLIKKGVVLLCMYLHDKQLPVNKILYLDNLVTISNYQSDGHWNNLEIYDYIDTLGNMYLTENKNITDKKLTAPQKLYRLKQVSAPSPFIELTELNTQNIWYVQNYQERQQRLTNRLRDFFLGKI